MPSFLTHSKIDQIKWNRCIEQSVNTRIYAMSWYLDIVSPNWSALIEGDYEIVMPLPGKIKFGFHYLIQPILTQQLGIFSSELPDQLKVTEFLQSIPPIFKYININLNDVNPVDSMFFDVAWRNNHELSLFPKYEVISKQYSRRTHRNLKKAKNLGLTWQYNMQPEEFMEFKSKHCTPAISMKEKYTILQIIKQSHKAGNGKIISLLTQEGNTCGAAFYMETHKRIMLFLTVSSEEGKENDAMFMILDEIIKQYSGSNLIMDFTGSTLKGVAYFNSGFGAIPVKYPNIKRNKLPWPIKLLKK